MQDEETQRTRDLLDQYLCGQSLSEGELFIKLRSELLHRAKQNPLMRQVKRFSSAEDVVDDVLLRALSSGVFASFQDGRPGTMGHLLAKILDNVIVDVIRRHSAQKRGGGAEPLTLSPPSGDSLESALEGRLASPEPSPTSAARAGELVELAQARLSVREWEVWRSTELDGLDSLQIAERLDVTDGAVRGLLRRARAKLLSAIAVPPNRNVPLDVDE